MLSVGGLFSGIGGIELGLERAGMHVLWHCEADPYARAILERHWPGVPCYEDVRELRGTDVEPVDVLCGGFPCQDISTAGAGAGIDGARSGLWSEYARLVGELRPRYVVVENVAALLGRGLERVLGDLSTLGYDAEWDCIPAAAVGARHLRDRLWLVAYPADDQPQEHEGDDGEQREWSAERRGEQLIAGARAGGRDGRRATAPGALGPHPGTGRPGDTQALADADRPARDGARAAGEALLEPGTLERSRRCCSGVAGGTGSIPDAYGLPPFGPPVAWRERGPWRTEPDVGRVAHGIPARLDRLRCLGNAVVPQIPEWIGRRIIEWEGGLT